MKVLYIAGAGRSGSTLLARTLGGIEGFFSAGELYHFFGRGAARNELCGCGRPMRDCPVWGRVLRRVETSSDAAGAWDYEALERVRDRVTRYGHLTRVWVPIAGRRCRREIARYRRAVGTVYRALSEVTGCRVIVDSSKSPSYGRLLLELPDLELHVVHLIRDSRGVAHSWSKLRRRPGARGSREYLNRRGTLSSALLWSAAQAATERLAARAATRVRVRYDEFVNGPRTVLGRILRSVGESESDPLAHVGNPAVRLGRQHVIAGNPLRMRSGRVVLSEDRAWQDEMGALRRMAVTALTAPLLLRYGWLPDPARAPADPGSKARERALDGAA